MYNLQGDKIDRRVCIPDRPRPLLTGFFLVLGLQLVFNSLFEVLFYSHALASLSVTGGSPGSPFSWLVTENCGKKRAVPGSRVLARTVSDAQLWSLCCLPKLVSLFPLQTT